MKKIFFIGILILKSCTGFATHYMGADLSYKCLTGDTIEFTLKLYRDCIGIVPSIAYPIFIESATCGIYTECEVYQVGTETEVSPLCPIYISQSSCNGGALPGVQQWIYSGKIYLPQPCDDYLFYWEDCCRNASITNVITPGSIGLRVEAKFNKLLALCNNSAAFSALPVFYVCVQQPINYFNGGYDVDGDSLVYNLITPLSNSGTGGYTPFQFISPFTANYPTTTPTGTIGFNSETGQITLTASNTEITCLAMRIEEYRNGILIGSVMRDLQLVILNCNNISPEIAGDLITNISGGTQTGAGQIEMCQNGQLTFDVTVHDPDGNQININSNIASLISGGNYTVIPYGVDSALVHFSLNLTATDTGYLNFNLLINDNACPVFGQNSYSYLVHIINSTSAGSNMAICAPATSVQLIATGGSLFSWTPTVGLNNPNIYNPIASPTVTTTYFLTSNLAGGCANNDSVIVAVNTPVNINTGTSQIAGCIGAPVQLNATISGGGGSGYAITWTNSAGGFVSNIGSPIIYPSTSEMFYIHVTSGSCIDDDSIAVSMFSFPENNITASPLTGCVPLTVTTTNNSTGGNIYYWNAGNGNISTLAEPVFTFNTPGNYSITYITENNAGCSDTTVISPVQVSTLPPAPSISIANGIITCTPYAMYYWYFNGILIPGNGPHQPCDSSGYYQVEVSWDFVCYRLSDSFYVDCNVGIENLNTKNSVSIFPNPLSETLNIHTSIPNENNRILISNTFGKLLVEEKLNHENVIINLDHIPSGIYFCVIKTEDGKMIQQKLVVQK